MAKEKQPKQVEALKHTEDKRKNNPTAEAQSLISASDAAPKVLRYPRNPDLDPQLVWRGKDPQDAADLAVQHTPLYIQEKVHPKVLIEDLLTQTKAGKPSSGEQLDLFSDFNGVPDGAAKTEFYQHDQNWTNRMILGDSLNVMTSLAERDGLRGMVQAIYLDPPYGKNFNSNFQWSTTTREVKDGRSDHITREPEMVKAFRDTWKDGVHSYLSYLRDRITAAHTLLSETGSIFVQISDDNVHRVRLLLDETFGEKNFVSQIHYMTTSNLSSGTLSRAGDYILWYAKDKQVLKARPLFSEKNDPLDDGQSKYDQVQDDKLNRRRISSQDRESTQTVSGTKLFRYASIDSQDPPPSPTPFKLFGKEYFPAKGRHWTANYPIGMNRLSLAGRLGLEGNRIAYIRYFEDFNITTLNNFWSDIRGTVQSRSDPKIYVVQTGTPVIQRCILMATDPGDLVLDPTCGSGTTATVAEQWGRRWITIDTSRVALALARARIMGARYPYYLLADSRDGQQREAEVTRTAPSSQPVQGNIRQGFVYERVPHITLKSIANNAEIDVIWDQWQAKLEPLREKLNAALKQNWQEWEIPRETDAQWPDAVKKLHADWWAARISRQEAIDKSIAAKANTNISMTNRTKTTRGCA